MRLYFLPPLTSLLLLFFLGPAVLSAAPDKAPEAKKSGPPAMLVEVNEITRGTAEPMVDLVGTIRYARVSRVATEVSGIVEKINFREGARVKVGQPLVQLRSDLREARVTGTRAEYQQAQIELERARKDLNRVKALFSDKLISESLYDENHYRVLAQEKRVAALKATLDLQLLEIKKTRIHAPFSGLVQEKLTEQGEWIADGGQIAVIADDQQIEVEIDVPRRLLNFLPPGRQISVRSGGQTYVGHFVHFIPQGDVATRTFTVKLALDKAEGLIEGMEALASLPDGPKLNSLMVPRDAVLKLSGKQIIFLAVEEKAKMVQVQIHGYQGMQVAIEGPELTEAQQVIVKGNERIRDGQAIRFSH